MITGRRKLEIMTDRRGYNYLLQWTKNLLGLLLLISTGFLLMNCNASKKSKKVPFDYGRAPKNYQEVINDYNNYNIHNGCKAGETIASIGAGNGLKEVQISCLVEGINWYLEEIDSLRLNQFEKVYSFHENLKGSSINAKFNLVLGTKFSTTLPEGFFDRVLMINVYHEISDRAPIMEEIHDLLKPGGEIVLMERMGDEPGQIHKDCKHPKLYEPQLIEEMNQYGFRLVKTINAEKMSNLTFYTFALSSE